MDIKARCYLLTGLLLIAKVDEFKETELARVQINQRSFVAPLMDGMHCKNTLVLCSHNISVVLTFTEKTDLLDNTKLISEAILEIYANEDKRKQRVSKFASKSYSSSVELRGRESYLIS